MKLAFYPGSFDPMTNGHLDIVIQALNLVPKLIVGVGIHPGKVPLFTFEERAGLISGALKECLPKRAADVSVIAFDGLVIDVARLHQATILIRGLRDGSDFDYEMQMAGMNGQMAPEIQTVFLPAGTASRPITATLVRQIAVMGGDVGAFVPPIVREAMNTKRKSQSV